MVTNGPCNRVEVPTTCVKSRRAARKGAGGRSLRIENRSSDEQVTDGVLNPNPEDSLHYRLLLSDGDINNRGEGVEEFNKLVCRPYYSVVRGQRQSG